MVTQKKITPAKAIKIIEEFLTAAQEFDLAAGLDALADDCVYENVPFHKAVGKENVLGDLAKMGKYIDSVDIVTHHISAKGGIVMTERTDVLSGPYFSIPIKIMGIFEVNDHGQIIAWRDYFDWLQFSLNALGDVAKLPLKLITRQK